MKIQWVYINYSNLNSFLIVFLDQTFGPYGIWPDINNITSHRTRWCTEENLLIREIKFRQSKNPYANDRGKIIKGLSFGYNDGTSMEVGMKSNNRNDGNDKTVKIETGTKISSVILASGWFIEQLGVRTTHNTHDGQLDNDRDGYIQIPPKNSDHFGASLKTICGETVLYPKDQDMDIIGNLYFTFKIESEPGKLYLSNISCENI